MESPNKNVLYDSIRNVRKIGKYEGSIISKTQDNKIIFSDNIKILQSNINIIRALLVGFEKTESNHLEAFSRHIDFNSQEKEINLEYSLLVPKDIMSQFDEGRFSDTYPFTINMLHTAGLYLNNNFEIDHLDFFKGEILKNPVALIYRGICIADRVVIDHYGDPVFYDTLIIGRDEYDDLNVSYEPILNVDDKIVKYIIILGNESLRE